MRSSRQKQLIRRTLSALAVLFSLCACTYNNYDAGDGEYSYLRADFGLFATNSRAEAVSFVTDEDRSFRLNSPVRIDGIKADTVYRALIYYNETAELQTDMRGLESVHVCRPVDIAEIEDFKSDPVGLESVWMSHNGEWLNMTLKLKVGVDESAEDNLQSIAIALSESEDAPDESVLTLYHDQNNMPEYYTQTVYLSIPLKEKFQPRKKLKLIVNTYKGEVVREFDMQ